MERQKQSIAEVEQKNIDKKDINRKKGEDKVKDRKRKIEIYKDRKRKSVKQILVLLLYAGNPFSLSIS